MRKLKNISLTFLTLLLLFTTSCSTDDEPSHTIKYLTGYSKIVFGESTIECDGVTRVFTTVITQTIQGEETILLGLNQNEYVALRVNALNELEATAILNGNQYLGTNFTVEEISTDVFKISGILTSDTADDKPFIIVYDESSEGAGDSTITISGNIATINGTLGKMSYNQILDLNHDNQQVHTLLLGDINGSVNDEINEQTGRLIREAGYTTWVNSTSKIYSGGVDLFCAGKIRKIDTGAELGVHSWCCGTNGEDAFEIPANDPQHNRPKTYLIEMLGEPYGSDFYFFAINAAPANDIHIMTSDEIEQYRLETP